MAKVQFEIDTDDLLDQIDAYDILDAFSQDISRGDCQWWADQVAKPLAEKCLELLKDKNSDFFKAVVQSVRYEIEREIDVRELMKKELMNKIEKVLNA